MDKLKTTQSWVIGESIVWSVFVIVNAISGLALKGVVKLTTSQTHFLGNVALAFALLAFFYLTFLASKQRSK